MRSRPTGGGRVGRGTGGSWGSPPRCAQVFSKRSDQIADYLEEMGYSSYRARNVAARRNRPVKRDTGTDQLMGRWVAELETHGWTLDRLAASLDRGPPTVPRPGAAVDRRGDRQAGR